MLKIKARDLKPNLMTEHGLVVDVHNFRGIYIVVQFEDFHWLDFSLDQPIVVLDFD